MSDLPVVCATFSAEGIRPWLQVFQFWMLEALFLALAIVTGLAFAALVRSLRAGWRWWSAVAALAIASWVIVITLPPTTNRIFFDEHIYQDVGRNLSDLRLAQTCHYGLVEYGHLQCLSAAYNKEPYGYPYLLSVAYRLAGVHEGAAHVVSRLSHVMLVLLLCVTAARWFGDKQAGLFAGLGATLLPEQLRWAATASAEPTASTFVLLAVLATVDFARSRTTLSLTWAVLACALAANMRPETVLVIPVCGLILLAEARDELARRRLWVAAGAGGVLMAGWLLHLLAVRHEAWGAPQQMFSWSHLPHNLVVNASFYLWDARFPFWLTLLAIGGLAVGAGARRSRLVAAAYFLAFWGVFLFFYAGGYDYGADIRFSLMSHAPLMLLAGLGLSALARRVPLGAARTAVVPGAIAAALVWMFSWHAPYVRAVGEEAWAARADVEFARSVAADLPAGALVLTHDPNMFLIWGRSAAQAVLATEQPDLLHHASKRHGGQVYFHWGFWCNVADPAQQRLCAAVLQKAPHRLVREQVNRSYRYAFYVFDVPQ